MAQLFIVEDMAWRCSIISSHLILVQSGVFLRFLRREQHWIHQPLQTEAHSGGRALFPGPCCENSGSCCSFWRDVMRCVSSDKICAMIIHDMPWCNAACLWDVYACFTCEFHVPQRFLLSPSGELPCATSIFRRIGPIFCVLSVP